MVITYLGGECFKITQGDLTIALNPPSKDSSFKASKFGSDIVLTTLNHEDFNGAEQMSFGEREPFVITGPGEYEVRGVSVRGFGAETEYGGEKGINTIYSIALEGMDLVFLGALGSSTLPQAAKAELDEIDILFLPIGGDGVLDHAEAYKLAVQLEPKVVVPMHYTPETLKKFLKEAGEEITPVDKLTLKRKDLEGKEGEIIVLSQN
ncbi:MAG: MBL fold metallo-hydrolase [Candidatus Pacebacteria bacterium]|nr:MBL fold metallo-hydrolase [Candidatus Paceibacterota bacterium]